MHTSNDTLSARDRAILSMTQADIDRFWTHVDKTPGYGPKGECWHWTKGHDRKGYGRFCLYPVTVLAHRTAFFLENGHLPPPETPLAMHSCDWPPCVRGDHLAAGTVKDNSHDMWAKGRGFSGDNHPLRRRPELAAHGERHWCAKLTTAAVLAMRADFATREFSPRQLAEKYGVSRSIAENVVYFRTWKHVRNWTPCPAPATVASGDSGGSGGGQ